jgi:hypothetical protein
MTILIWLSWPLAPKIKYYIIIIIGSNSEFLPADIVISLDEPVVNVGHLKATCCNIIVWYGFNTRSDQQKERRNWQYVLSPCNFPIGISAILCDLKTTNLHMKFFQYYAYNEHDISKLILYLF